MKRLLKNLAAEDAGQDLIEYALIAALIGLTVAAVVRGLSNNIGKTFNTVGTDLTNATS